MKKQIKKHIEMQCIGIIGKQLPKGLNKLLASKDKSLKIFKPEVLGYDNLIEILQRKRISTLYSFKEVSSTLAKQLFDHSITVIRLQSKEKKSRQQIIIEGNFYTSP